MPSAADLTPEEVATALAARRKVKPLEDELPASLTARLDREVAARVDAELALRGGQGESGQAAPPKEGHSSGTAVGVMSVIMAVPLTGIAVGTTHNVFGAAVVMAGLAAVNWAHAFGRRRR